MRRVFVLCTGRCGSLTFAAACRHSTSHTAGHETRAHLLDGRLNYPARHIEVDNRLAWHLGELDRRYGDDAVYVHLTRDQEAVARSYARRFHIRAGIMPAYASGIIRARLLPQTDGDRLAAARNYVDTVTANIQHFLRDKPLVVHVPIESPADGFARMWQMAGATGDQAAALSALTERHNAS